MNTKLYSYWHQVPFVRIIFPFILGIATGMFIELSYLQALLLITFFAVGYLFSSYFIKHFSKDWLKGFILNILIFCFGIGLHVSQKDILKPTHFSKYESCYLQVRITEPLLERKKSYKALVDVWAVIDSNGILQNCMGNMVLYFAKDTSIINALHYGDVLLIKSNYKEAKAPQNPYEFNYKRYLAFNNIYHQSYMQESDFIHTNVSSKNILFEYAYASQQYFKDVLNKYVESKTEVAVSQALLYGFDDDIDADVVKAYSNTGTLHVLAVSGMHVGIIFWIITKLLFFLDKKRWGNILKAIISILLLWAYSLLCGFSPSILRATVMFSFIIIGKAFKRDINIYNTLAASAFCILIFDTNIISNVGFQLSYLAVIGIVTFQQRIYNWYTPTYWVSKEIWSITAVSIAAQLATFPLGLLYFHQFPYCFLFSNLIIIPLTTGILFLVLALVSIAWFDWAASVIGFIIKWLIYLTNKIVIIVEAIPYAYSNGFHISIVETIFIYLLIIYLFFWLIRIRHHYFTYAMVLSLIIVLINVKEKINQRKQSFITFYNIPKSTAFNVTQNNQTMLFADSSLLGDDEKFRFHIQQHIWAQGIDKLNKFQLKKSAAIHLDNKNLLYCNDKIDSNALAKSDIVLLGKNAFVDFNTINKQAKALFVLGSDIPNSKRKYFRNKLHELNILFVDLSETGYHIINL